MGNKKVFITFFCLLSTLSFAQPLSWAETSLLDNRLLYPEYSRTISMDFKEADLNDVLKIFSQQSGLNFIAAQNIADKKITLFLDKVPVEEALERILTANGLTYEIQSDSNIFIVKAAPPASRDLETRVYPLKFATVLSSKLNQTLSIQDKEDSGGSSSDSSDGGSGGGGGGGKAIGLDANIPKDIGIFAAIKAVLTELGTLVEDPRTNSLIITDIPTQFPLIERVLARLDVPVPQILIEVEMLDVSKEVADKMGVKIGESPLSFTGAQRAHFYPWNQNQLLREGKISEPSYTAGTISAAGLTAALQFLKTNTDTKNLARPRILTLNNETAQIKIATDEAIGIATVTGSADSLSSQSVEAERVETGVFLTVTPQANLLTNDIVMAISPRVIQARTGGTFQGQTFKDPEERGAKTTMRVHDGDTVILGGLLRTDLSDARTKVPIVGNIPILGTAFRHKNRSDTERELIIFLTPHILKEQKNSKIAMTNSRPLAREQDLPSPRQEEIEKALTSLERLGQ